MSEELKRAHAAIRMLLKRLEEPIELARAELARAEPQTAAAEARAGQLAENQRRSEEAERIKPRPTPPWDPGVEFEPRNARVVGLPVYATVREATGPNGWGTEWHIECRFPDGQKYAPVVVDGDHEQLAHFIAQCICDHSGPSAPTGMTMW